MDEKNINEIGNHSNDIGSDNVSYTIPGEEIPEVPERGQERHTDPDDERFGAPDRPPAPPARTGDCSRRAGNAGHNRSCSGNPDNEFEPDFGAASPERFGLENGCDEHNVSDRRHICGRGRGRHMFIDPPPPPPDGRELTPMQLTLELSKLFHNMMRSDEDQNLHNSYRLLLFHLARHDGRTQYDLACATHLKPPTISVTLQKMQADGYVKRVTDERDQRQTLVYLTDKGRKYNADIAERISRFEYIVMKDISEDEKTVLTAMLKKMIKNIINGDWKNTGNEAD